MFNRNKRTISVKGMQCHHCENAVELSIRGNCDWVTKVKADHEENSVTVFYKGEWSEDRMNEVKEAVRTAGYEVE